MLLDKLNINIDEKPKVVFGSHTGSGKTTILTILACESFLKGKKVLFLSETKITPIIKRMENYLGYKPDRKRIIIQSVGGLDSDLESFMTKKIDLVVIDFNYTNYDNLNKLVEKYDVALFTSVKLNKFLPKDGLYDTNIKPMFFSDVFITISRLFGDQQYYKKLLRKLFFWKIKPNTIIKVYKNKFGDNVSVKVEVDFEKTKIKF